MKKSFKKFGVIVLALAMVFALTATAWAADPAPAPASIGVYTDDGQTVVDATNNTIPLTKSIIFFNLNGSKVYEPNISYTYTVAPVDDPTKLGTITDDGDLNTPSNDPVTVKANAGVANGVYFNGTANTIAFSSDNSVVTTKANGVKVTKNTNLTVDLSKFTHAGVYRYEITENNTAANKNAVGIVPGEDYESTRYLDVYLSNGGTVSTTNPAGLKLYGAVLFKTSVLTPTGSDPVNVDTNTKKTTGFEPGVPETGSDVNYTGDTVCDHYTTYDFTVKKSITGGMADKSHQFPFYVSITNSIAGAAYTYYDDPGTGTGAKETLATGVTTIVKGSDSISSTLKLADGEYVKFVGVPSNQSNPLSIDIKEYNDSVDAYTPSVKATNGTPEMASGAAMAAGTGSDSVNTFVLKTNDVAAQIITVTNTLAEISVTGVTMRIAPFAAMAGAGIVFLAVSKKSKKEEEDA